MRLHEYLLDDGGAVTVDFVTITATIVGLGLAVTVVIGQGVEDATDNFTTTIASMDPQSVLDWGDDAGWGELALYSPRQSQEQAESYVAGVLNSHGGNHQAAYDQLYGYALNMRYSDGESIDDFGAFMALAEADGATINTGDDLSYVELHNRYAQDPWDRSSPLDP